MSFLDKLYSISPIIIQNLFVSASGYIRNVSRYGNEYKKHMKFLSEFDQLDLVKKKEIQLNEMKSFINTAKEKSSYYKELYKDIDTDSIKSLNDLSLLPIIDKEMIRENISEICTVSKNEAVEGHTGGTTGKSLVVLFTKKDMMRRMAMLDHFKLRVGFLHRKMRRATFNGKHIVPPHQKKQIFWRYNMACKQMIYSSFHLTEENIGSYVQSLNKFKPQAIDGFFMSICDVASYIERHNLKLTFRPIAVFPTSETLTKSGRELIERVFQTKVYDQYASSEGAPFVTECSKQNLHIEHSSGVFEHFGEGNEVLVTSFTTNGTPLIRYKIGDDLVFEMDQKTCKCGLESLMVKEIRGRKLDFLYRADGAKINGGNVANLFKNMPNALIRAQTTQNKINEIEIKLEVDKQRYTKEYDDLLRSEFLSKFGNETKLTILHVDHIPRERSGKYKLIKNTVKI